MIHESYYWKKELYTSFLTVAKFRTFKRKAEPSLVKVEKALMFGAYVIRKLDDAQKLPPDLLLQNEAIARFESKKTTVDYMNWHYIDKHYNLNRSHTEQHNWKFIINQLIHSYSFIYSFDNQDKFAGILINSDDTNKNSLFFFPVDLLLRILLTVSEGGITSAKSERKILGKDKNGKKISGELKLIKAVYSYPFQNDIKKIIEETMQGKLYKRTKEE